MAKCPYAPHRLVLSNDGYCQRCAGDLRLYAALRWLPELLFNDAHRLVEAGQHQSAAMLLQRAIALRTDFPEARSLLEFIESRRPEAEEAPLSLEPLHSCAAAAALVSQESVSDATCDSPAAKMAEIAPESVIGPQSSQIEDLLSEAQGTQVAEVTKTAGDSN